MILLQPEFLNCRMISRSLFFSCSPPNIISTDFAHISSISARPTPKCSAARRYSFETGLQKKPTSSVYQPKDKSA